MLSVSFDYDWIDEKSLDRLKALDFSQTGTRRLCLHNNPDKGLQVMLIELYKDTVFPSHCHERSDEVVVLFEGSIRYTYADKQTFELNASSKRSVIIPKGTFHSVQAGTDGAIYLEIVNNP